MLELVDLAGIRRDLAEILPGSAEILPGSVEILPRSVDLAGINAVVGVDAVSPGSCRDESRSHRDQARSLAKAVRSHRPITSSSDGLVVRNKI